MKFADFWYVVALSQQLKRNTVLARSLLNEWLVVFRDQAGNPVALRDRCLHRNSRLSCGRVYQGQLQCPYHGWMYNQNGEVVAVPAAGTSFNLSGSRRANCYQTKEQDGYIYVRLATEPSDNFLPFAMPHYDESGWQTVRLTHRFQNNVTNCVENFIDTPHTAFVHPGVFRDQQQQQLEMHVERRDGAVFVEYHNEKTNLGWYRYFLNWHEQEIKHCDRFQMPNVTCVEYDMGKNRHLFITSQSIPEAEDSTLVYTDVTFNYGVWNLLARPFVRWTAQRIIRQDVEILQIQGETIAKYGSQFAHTPADTIHCFVESIRNAIARGEDPRQLPKQAVKVTFWV